MIYLSTRFQKEMLKKLKESFKFGDKILKRRVFSLGDTIIDEYRTSIELPKGLSVGMSRKFYELFRGDDKIEYHCRPIYKGAELVGYIIDELTRSKHPDGSEEIIEFSYVFSKSPLTLRIVNVNNDRVTRLPVDPVEEKIFITVEELVGNCK